jgi:hypothetical protein
MALRNSIRTGFLTQTRCDKMRRISDARSITPIGYAMLTSNAPSLFSNRYRPWYSRTSQLFQKERSA